MSDEPPQHPQGPHTAVGGLGEDVDSHSRLLALYQAERERRQHLELQLQEVESAQKQLEQYAVDLQRTYSELRRQLNHLTVLHDLSRAISAALDPEAVVTGSLDALGQLLAYDAVSVYLLGDEQPEARRTASRGPEALQPPELIPRGESLVGRALADGSTHMDVIRREAQPVLVAAVPLRARDRTLGAIYLARTESVGLPQTELQLVELLAASASVAMENALLYQATQWLAATDPLTEVPNYRYFRQALELEVERARRMRYPLGLLMADLDRFKSINDAFGHPTGDRVLVAVAQAMRAELRRTDVMARVGGEEFAIILPGVSLEGVAAVGEKLRRAVAAIPSPAGDGQPRLQVTLSLGGIALAAEQLDPEALINAADQALYRSKESGRDRVSVATS